MSAVDVTSKQYEIFTDAEMPYGSISNQSQFIVLLAVADA